MKIILKLTSMAALIGVASNANAGELFIGVTAGQSDFTGLTEACDEFLEDNRAILSTFRCNVQEDSDTTLGINAGYNFNDYIGLEAGYLDFGEYSALLGVNRFSVEINADLDATYGGLVLSLPFSNKLSVSARLGAVNGNLDAQSGLASLSLEDETGAFAGASIDYRITDNLGIQIRYDDFDVINLTSAGIRYYF